MTIMPGKETTPSQLAHVPASSRSPEEARLGRLLAVHRGVQPGLGNALLLLVSGLIVLLSLGYGFWRAISAYVQDGSVTVDFWSSFWLTLTVLALACFLVLAGYRLYRWRRFVAVYKQGLRLRLGFFRSQTLKWRDLAGVSSIVIQERFLHLPINTTHRAILFPHRGRPIQIRGPLQEMPTLIARLKANLYPRLLPGLREAFNAGARLCFGPISIQRQGIGLQSGQAHPSSPSSDLVPWGEVAVIDVQTGCLVVKLRDGKTWRVPVIKIPNLEILLELAHQGVQS